MPKRKKRANREIRVSDPIGVIDDNLRENTVILFVDVIGASEVSNHLSVSDYKDFVQEFRKVFESACNKYFDNWLKDLEKDEEYHYSARGDEGILLIYPRDETEDPSSLIDIAINIALDLKRSWLLSTHNLSNVTNGIVPIELAVGIHVGHTYLGEDRKPDGYAINLAKRVESFSRTGQYTHIFVSETAHGFLNRLADEKTYLFDEPKSLTAKGFSREIRAFEVMHHFLPTDWTDGVEEPAQNPYSNVLLQVPSKEDIKVLRSALKLNPTNIWLAEECIRAYMLYSFKQLSEKEREQPDKLRAAYEEAMEIISYLSQGDQRDPGVLMIKGLIHGEAYDFKQENACYEQAREFKRQVSILDWYQGYALSYEIWYEIGGERLAEKEIRKLTRDSIIPCKSARLTANEIGERIEKATTLLARAAESARWAAWIHYTYGCELVMWGDNVQRDKGISEIDTACRLLEDVKVDIPNERYLTKVKNDPKIKLLLK